MGVKAVGKELELETMIKKEEKKRERTKAKKLLKKLKCEKTKRHALKRQIKRRELDTQILMDKREAESEVTNIKEEMKMEIQMKRKELKRMVSSMRKKARRRRAVLETELNKMRVKMAKDIMLANRDGEIGLCKKGKRSPAKREEYCNTNFVSDYLRNYDCKVPESFCMTCCENEFGNNFVDKREECYDMCDGKPHTQKSLVKQKKQFASKKQTKEEMRRTLMTGGTMTAGGIMSPVRKSKLGGWVWTPTLKAKALKARKQF